MADSSGVSGLPTPPSNTPPSGIPPSGTASGDFKGLPSAGASGLNLSSDQMNQVQNIRSNAGYNGPISPLEIWFMEHAGGDPIEGIVMYQRFIQSMMMTCITGLSGTQKASMDRQKQADQQAYGGMA